MIDYQKRDQIRAKIAIKFLKGMQIDKICSLGKNDAKQYNSQIQNVIDDIKIFYAL